MSEVLAWALAAFFLWAWVGRRRKYAILASERDLWRDAARRRFAPSPN